VGLVVIDNTSVLPDNVPTFIILGFAIFNLYPPNIIDNAIDFPAEIPSP
jgi:hypothetical protein